MWYLLSLHSKLQKQNKAHNYVMRMIRSFHVWNDKTAQYDKIDVCELNLHKAGKSDCAFQGGHLLYSSVLNLFLEAVSTGTFIPPELCFTRTIKSYTMQNKICFQPLEQKCLNCFGFDFWKLQPFLHPLDVLVEANLL